MRMARRAGGRCSHSIPMTLDELNRMDERAFTAALGGIYEHSPWVASGAAAGRPYESVGALAAAMASVVAGAGERGSLR